MSKHTPGPWQLIKPGIGYFDDLKALEGRTWGVAADSFGDKLHTIVRGTEEANARLIAAAPEMLEALRDAACTLLSADGCEMEYGVAKDLSALLKRLNAAIAAATGAE
jgi:hypothetical protein